MITFKRNRAFRNKVSQVFSKLPSTAPRTPSDTHIWDEYTTQHEQVRGTLLPPQNALILECQLAPRGRTA